MCLFPKIIRNPSKRLHRTGGQPLYLNVPCNKCAECKDKKRLEWHFRSYHEVNSIIQHGGYVVYDTLTYSEDNVPHLSDFIDTDKLQIQDFYCFNTMHWRNFLKNLRRHLDYHYPTVKLRYFLTSEYGTDERYTHRPHYHVLFFVNNKKLHPIDLSRLISKLWTYGRTDGIDYHDMNYFSDNVFGYDIGFGHNSDVLKVCSYITKYVTKDSTFQTSIDNRLNLIDKRVNDENLCNELKRTINQYHRQSQGFGLSYLNTLDASSYSAIMDKGICTLEDKDDIILTIPLPLYYKRKLFYKYSKDDDGSVVWIPNNLGKQYIENNLLRLVDKTYQRYYNEYINLSQHDKQFISYLLGSRSLYDFSIYISLYRYRNLNYSSDKLPYPDEWFQQLVYASTVHASTDLTSLVRDVDSNTISIPVDLFNSVKRDYNSYLSNQCINENTCSDFRHFDSIALFFEQIQSQVNLFKQRYCDELDFLTKKFKILYGKF